MGTKKVAVRRVLMSAEGAAAEKRKGPTVSRMVRIMNDTDGKSLAESWEQRWLAARALEMLGYKLEKVK